MSFPALIGIILFTSIICGKIRVPVLRGARVAKLLYSVIAIANPKAHNAALARSYSHISVKKSTL